MVTGLFIQDTNIYYNPSTILSYNRLLNFIVGERGYGKTFAFKKWAIDDFLKRKNQFIWLRRYKTEIKVVKSELFTDIQSFYPDHLFEIKGNVIYIDKNKAGYILPLSSAQSYKSTPFPKVNKIIFDEFIVNKSCIHYLHNEVEQFLDFFSTVARLRDNVRAFFLANAVSVNNPYFDYFNIYPVEDKRFIKNESICIEQANGTEYRKEAKKTKFGKLISNSRYGNYAIENKYLLDNDEFVADKPPQSFYKLTLCYNNKYYGVYYSYSHKCLYINERKNLNGGNAIAITKDDMKENTMLYKTSRLKEYIYFIKEMFSQSKIIYESIRVKSAFYDIMKVLNM